MASTVTATTHPPMPMCLYASGSANTVLKKQNNIGRLTMTLTKRTLGRTGLEVTDLSYGAMEVRGSRIWGGRPLEEGQAETILNAVVDNGVNFIDTANDYGRSEEFIGKYLSH